MKSPKKHFEDNFFYDELNRFVGSGGEVFLKGARNLNSSSTRMDVGDRLIGIGVTHVIENLSQPPGPDSFEAMNFSTGKELKKAVRAFEVAKKSNGPDGFDFEFKPLSPQDYCDTLELVSTGAVRIRPESIPPGTIILSFLDSTQTYTLRTVPGSPSENWVRAVKGTRHWNVGIATSEDFWSASFPSDDIGLLTQLPPSAKAGRITFGLSLMPKSKGKANLIPVSIAELSGRSTHHHFYLEGHACGVKGLDTPFMIGLRTEIIFHPTK
jgi:hypothetical protein